MNRTRIKSRTDTHVTRGWRETARARAVGGDGQSTGGSRFFTCVQLVVISLLFGCTGAADGCSSDSQRGSIAVASSLTDWSGEFVESFDIEHRVSIAGSQMLRLQIQNGARPDVFVSANREHAEAVARLDAYGEAEPFICNEMTVAYAKSSFGEAPDFISAMSTNPRVAIADAAVPAGRYGIELIDRLAARLPTLDAEAVLDNVVSYDLNVRQVLMRLVRGEADIAFVYASDTQQAEEAVARVTLPAGVSPQAHYFITHRSTETAVRLGEQMQSEASKRIAESLGFTICDDAPPGDAMGHQ